MSAASMPRYKCHKEVRALKIASVEYLAGNQAVLQFHDRTFPAVTVSLESKPRPSNDWYYVVYENGYVSFSPGKEFEEGYSLIVEAL